MFLMLYCMSFCALVYEMNDLLYGHVAVEYERLTEKNLQ